MQKLKRNVKKEEALLFNPNLMAIIGNNQESEEATSNYFDNMKKRLDEVIASSQKVITSNETLLKELLI